jgi:hypothetical protein
VEAQNPCHRTSATKRPTMPQQLARHPEAIKAGIQRAREKGEIPTRRALLGIIRSEVKHAPKVVRPLPVQHYNCIYADPPWRFGDGTTDAKVEGRRSAARARHPAPSHPSIIVVCAR